MDFSGSHGKEINNLIFLPRKVSLVEKSLRCWVLLTFSSLKGSIIITEYKFSKAINIIELFNQVKRKIINRLVNLILFRFIMWGVYDVGESEIDDVELSDCTLMALRFHELADQYKGWK